MTSDRVAALLDDGYSISEIARTLAIAKSTVCYHARRSGRPAEARFAVRYDWRAIREHYEAGHSVRECQERFGFSGSTWADAVRRGDVRPRPRGRSLDSYLAARSRTVRGGLKRRLFAEGLKHNACERCGIEHWRGRPLAFALHHVNGDGSDNRLENLRLLCPNCHSQTDNYGGRNVCRAPAREAEAIAATGESVGETCPTA